MIYREEDNEYQSALYYDLILDDIVLSDFGGSAEQLQHLLNIDCALALSVCKSRNLPSCVFVLSLLYIKRLRSLHSLSSLSKIDDLTTKELYLIATLLANKYLIDEGEEEQLFNSELAELTGIHTERIDLIERQVLLALDWNLYVSNDEFQEFFSLFKCQMARKLNKTIEKIEIEDPIKFYDLCFQFLPQIMEYFALTSLVLLGSTLSILTAIHISTLTHSTLMKTLNPTINCSDLSICHWNDHERTNTSHIKQNKFFNFARYPWNAQTDFTNETSDKLQSAMTLFNLPCCSIDLLQPYSLSRPFVQTVGDSNESSISASSLTSTCNHSHLQCSHYAGSFRRAPPPYNMTIYLSLPSLYESHVSENPSIPVTPPTMKSIVNQSLTLPHPSIQTHCFNLYLPI